MNVEILFYIKKCYQIRVKKHFYSFSLVGAQYAQGALNRKYCCKLGRFVDFNDIEDPIFEYTPYFFPYIS